MNIHYNFAFVFYDYLNDKIVIGKLEFNYYNNIYTDYRKLSNKEFSLVKKVKNPLGGGIKGKKKKNLNLNLLKAPNKKYKFKELRDYIDERYSKFKWEDIKFENNCVEKQKEIIKKIKYNTFGGKNNSLPIQIKNLPPSLPPKDERLITFTPTQEFVSNYFNHSSVYKGLLLWHSVGTGKTCSAVSIATKGFEEHNYTILWVTRHTLKSDIWKNMFQQVCSSVIRRQIINKENIPKIIKKNYLKYLSDSWIMPISYKQFSNMLAGKNSIYKLMQKRNGTQDILKKTLVIIDEAHKLYSPDIKASEKPNVEIMNKLIKNSYNISGKDSVKLLLLTATPYTSDPMHLIKLINLMKETDELPDDFNEFTKEYLDETTSKFTDKGAEKYLNDITGYISYLNRDRDVRNFAYPVFYNIEAKISKSNNLQDIKKNIENESTKLNENEEKLKTADKKDKTELKENIKKNKLNIKNYKKELKKERDGDISQENLLQKCIGKEK